MTVIPHRWGSPIISKVSVSESQLNSHERLFMTKYCKQIVTRTRVYSMSLLSREDCSFIFLVFNLILTGLRKRKSSKTNLNASPYGILLREN